jgi:hypothetical protein
MEIIKSRYGLDRTVEKLDYQTLRVMGESKYIRTSENKSGNPTMFDFEGGPCLTVGGKIQYGKLNWKITEIKSATPAYKDLSACLVTVVPIY